MQGEQAILMAAGLGSRMRPLTDSIPKPLVKARGRALVETVIDALLNRGVQDIYLVVGYKAEQFAPLASRYPCVHIVENPDYANANNISSVHAALPHIGCNDCFICEADLFVDDPTLLDTCLDQSCYFAKKVLGWSDDWVFDTDDAGRIVRVGKGGQDAFNMVGVAYFKASDTSLLAAFIDEEYAKPENKDLFWDEVVDRHLDELDLAIHEVAPEQLVEVDTLDELAAIDSAWREANGFQDKSNECRG